VSITSRRCYRQPIGVPSSEPETFAPAPLNRRKRPVLLIVNSPKRKPPALAPTRPGQSGRMFSAGRGDWRCGLPAAGGLLWSPSALDRVFGEGKHACEILDTSGACRIDRSGVRTATSLSAGREQDRPLAQRRSQSTRRAAPGRAGTTPGAGGRRTLLARLIGPVLSIGHPNGKGHTEAAIGRSGRTKPAVLKSNHVVIGGSRRNITGVTIVPALSVGPRLIDTTSSGRTKHGASRNSHAATTGWRKSVIA
jgi:hypothetical protein